MCRSSSIACLDRVRMLRGCARMHDERRRNNRDIPNLIGAINRGDPAARATKAILIDFGKQIKKPLA